MVTSKKIFLDLDGTLLDIENRYLNLFNYICKIFNIDNVSPIFFWKRKREGETNIQILKNYGFDDKLLYNFQNFWISSIESNFWLGFDKLQDDAYDFLNYLDDQKFGIYLLTGRNNRVELIQQLKRLKIDKYFEKVFNVEIFDLVKHKEKLLDMYQPDYFIGDTEVDYKSCRNLGVKFYCVNNGFRSKSFLEKNKIDVSFENLSNLKSSLK
jgi:phosphoglycolate phosphatase-like HAD superfamily hydrolase